MYRKILLAGTTAAVIVGAGGTALAVSGSDTTSGSPANSNQQGQHSGKHGKQGKHGRHGFGQLRRLTHGEFTVKGKDGKFVTHDVINGSVTAVSATSITVRAADTKSETFTVDKDTKVFQRTVAKKSSNSTSQQRSAHRAKPTPSSIGKVTTGDHVTVAGTGTTTLTAKRVVDLKS